MASIAEGIHSQAFILSEANGNRSRENEIVDESLTLTAGMLVGRLNANQRITFYDGGAADGSETAIGVLMHDVQTDAGEITTKAAVLSRDAEVIEGELQATGNGAVDPAGIADLLAVNIIVRGN